MAPFPHKIENKKPEEYQKACEELIKHVAPRDDSQWPIAREKLLDYYGLKAELIDQLHQEGSVYANILHIIFPHRFHGHGRIIGTTLQPVEENSAWKTIGDNSSAWFVLGNLHSASTVVAVESPFEALSYYNLSSNSAIVSCGGSRISPQLMQVLKENEQKLIISFSQNASKQLKKIHKENQKIRHQNNLN